MAGNERVMKGRSSATSGEGTTSAHTERKREGVSYVERDRFGERQRDRIDIEIETQTQTELIRSDIEVHIHLLLIS